MAYRTRKGAGLAWSHAKPRSSKHWVGALSLGLLLASGAALADKTAVYTSGERLENAAIEQCRIDRDGVQGTLVAGGEEHGLAGLVRWGEPTAAGPRTAVVLAEGTRLLSDRPWSPAGLARVDETKVRLRRGKAWVDFPRDVVRWVLLSPESVGIDAERLPDDATGGEEDVVYLAEGDRLSGRVESLSSDTLRLVVADAPVETPLESVAAIRLHGADRRAADAACLIGMNDGSLLHADRFAIADGAFTASVRGAEVTGDASLIALVQPLASGARYLSDLEPVDYRHTPYLDLPWPYSRDEGVLGGPLVGGGRRAAKGVAMHTAARLVYRLDDGAGRFQAEIAVADPDPPAAPVGSVVFRVYVVRDGKFEPGYESGVVLVGDPAMPVDVDLTGAVALALVVDYADDGDAGDNAMWLDARLTSSE